jgi:hypothetical protein
MSVEWDDSEWLPVYNETCEGKFQIIRQSAYEQAIKEADSFKPPKIKKDVKHLGQKIAARYAEIYECTNDPESAVQVSTRWLFIQSLSYALAWQGWIEEGLIEESETSKRILNNLSNKNFDGLATDFYINRVSRERYYILCGCDYLDTINQLSDDGQALVWFSEADLKIQSGNVIGALEKIGDAFYADGQAGMEAAYRAGYEGKEYLPEVFSKLGKSGADKRHAPMKELREWTIEQYKAGNWIAKNESANKAAHDLKEKVLAQGKIINPELAILSEQNAQRTIAEWIRKSA